MDLDTGRYDINPGVAEKVETPGCFTGKLYLVLFKCVRSVYSSNVLKRYQQD